MESRTLSLAIALHVLSSGFAFVADVRADDEPSAYRAAAGALDPSADWVAQADGARAGGLPLTPGRREAKDVPARPLPAEQMIGDMVTTARRRDELVQKSPVAVSAFDAKTIERQDVRRLSDLDGSVPNFSIDGALGGANVGRLTIRGVGQVETNTAFDPAVGVYVDGVYLPRSQGLLLPLFDVERVEVVRGPQGTLFGKNTIGGAINVVTAKPEFDFSATAGVRVGNFDQLDTRMTVNVPLVPERAAARVSFATNYDDGFQKNTFRGDRMGNDRLLGGRGELLLLPSDSVEIMLSGEYARQDRRPRAGKCVVVGPASPAIAAVEGPALLSEQFATCAADAVRSEFKGASDFGAEDDLRTTALSAQITWDINTNLMLKSITSYRDLDNDVGQDLDASELNLAQPPFPGTSKSRAVSQELQLNGRAMGESLVYVLGLFAFEEDISDNVAAGASILAPELQKRDRFNGLELIPIAEESRKIDNQNYAAYAQLSFAITDQLTFSAGLRRTLERRRLSKQDVTTGLTFSTTGSPAAAPAGTTIFGFERSERFGDWSPNATLAYQATPTILTYASYSTGFRSGGFNGRATSLNMDTAKIDPEDLTTYEVGAKTTFLDDRVLINAASFFSIYSDIQRPILQASAVGVPTVVFRNAAEARLRGAELELVALPVTNLRLETSLSAFRSRYTEFDSATQPRIEDARLPDQPNYLLSFAVGYEKELSSLGLFSTRLQWTHRGTQGNDTVDSRSVRSNKYGLLDGRVALELADGKTELALFGTNLLDRFYFTNGFDASDSVGVALRFPGPPRRYGVELRRAF
jgi:iron complex outermembrane recepter protein